VRGLLGFAAVRALSELLKVADQGVNADGSRVREFQGDLWAAFEKQDDLTVDIERAGRNVTVTCDGFIRDAECLDPFSCDACDVDKQKAKVGEDNQIPNGFENGVDSFTFEEKVRDAIVFSVNIDTGCGAENAFDCAHVRNVDDGMDAGCAPGWPLTGL
jgi:hypothetical protein